jgi:hypothetical protein
MGSVSAPFPIGRPFAGASNRTTDDQDAKACAGQGVPTR